MRIALLDIWEAGDKKDYNGGYGTAFYAGTSLRGGLLKRYREWRECIPLMSYGYLSAVLRAAGHEVFLARNRVPRRSDLLILHASLIRHNEEMAYLRSVRANSQARICVVGPLASASPQLFTSVADTVITGEAEKAFCTFKGLSDLPRGIVDAGYVHNLDELPFPDWSIYEGIHLSLFPIFKTDPLAFMQASRSCASSCSYCPYIALRKPYRARSPEHVLQEIIHLQSKYGTRSILFRDPHFTFHRQRTIQLCSLIKNAGIKVEWGCDTRSDTLDESLIDVMYDAGLRVVEIGVEAADHALLRKYRRLPPAMEHQERVIRYAEKRGISVIAFYLLGFPEDTAESIEKTIRYAKKLNTAGANFTIVTPIPGTSFYERIKDKIIDTNLNHYDNFHAVFSPDSLTPMQVQRYQEQALVSYYFRPSYLLRHLRKFL